ncbi:MAG: hypothetical protein AB7E84_00270 [Xanthobacteraceae bacterium]
MNTKLAAALLRLHLDDAIEQVDVVPCEDGATLALYWYTADAEGIVMIEDRQ